MDTNIRKIELKVLRLFENIFNFVSSKISYTFAVAFTTSLYGFLIAIYTAIFLMTTVQFGKGGVGFNFVTLFSLLTICIYAPGHFIHFGLLSRFGVKCFSKDLELINDHIKNNELVDMPRSERAVDILRAFEKLPKIDMYAAFLYASIVMVIVVIHEAVIGTNFGAAMIAVGIMSAIFIYLLITYVAAELLTSQMRRNIKKYLVQNKIEFEEKSSFSIRQKFIFINIFVLVAMIELGLMFYFSSTKGLTLRPFLFILIAGIMVGSILFFYLISIENSLLDIEYATLDLAGGGKGKLFLGGLDRELLNTSKGFISAAFEVNDMRTNLEKKVEERTKQLHKTMSKLQLILDEVQELKNIQDGDYYLTSLLLDPLSKNQAQCDNIKIDIFLKQKKEFKFKKWEKEIGGDICASYNLNLKGKQYAAFLNADAMGKSMQGAGGALVLGAGFKAIVERNRFSSIDQDQHPEHWITNSVKELQSVFESFDGSMLISFVMGLVDNETGVVYYVNAEHPWTVLYRDKKAAFIESELYLRKLGINNEGKPVKVHIFGMEAGDIIIAGSDGKDDILIFDENSSERIMNEDETLFLKYVEENDGDLLSIYESILSSSEITDDISMIRISYKEGAEVKNNDEIDSTLEEIKIMVHEGKLDESIKKLEYLYSGDQSNTAALKEYIKLLINRKRDYETASGLIEKYIELRPEDTEFLYISSICFQKIKKYKKSVEYSERAYLRNPDEIKYVIQYAKSNINIKNFIEADKLLDLALKIDPDNEKALKLKDSL